jgi:hypothetical protein
MIIWGGSQSGFLNTGGRYNPLTDSWQATSTLNAPDVRALHVAVWTGREMIVWAGQGLSFSSGGRYDPSNNTWVAVCEQNAAAGRVYATAIWTGSEMIAWGGDDGTFQRLNTGARYSIQGTPGPIQLLLDASGPSPDQAAALDSMLSLRDPFPVLNSANLLNQGPDRNTRVVIFASNLLLLPGELSSSVHVLLTDSNNQTYDLLAEDVRSVANFVQVTFRLPNSLPAGSCTVKVSAHGQVSNAGSIRIRV